MTLRYETLTLPRDDEQSVMIYTADRGSPSQEKLQLLASWNAPTMEPIVHQHGSAARAVTVAPAAMAASSQPVDPADPAVRRAPGYR